MASNTNLVERLLRQSVLLYGQTTISFSKTLSTEGLLILTIDENAGEKIVVKISEVREIPEEEADPNWKHKSVDQDQLKRLLDNSIMTITRETLKVRKSIKLDGLIAYKVDNCRYYVVKLGHNVKSSSQGKKGGHSAREQNLVDPRNRLDKHQELHANAEHKRLNMYEHGNREVETSKHANKMITVKNVDKAKAYSAKDFFNFSHSKETILIHQRNLSPAEEKTSAASVNTAHNVNYHRVKFVDGANNVPNHLVPSLTAANNVTNHLVTSGNGANNVTNLRVTSGNAANNVTNLRVTSGNGANNVTNLRVTSENGANNVPNHLVPSVTAANNITNHLVTSENGANNVYNGPLTLGNEANYVNFQGFTGTSMRIEKTNNTQKLSATSSEPESQRMTNVVNTLLAPLSSFGVDYYQEKGLKIYEEPNIRCAKCNYVCQNICLLEIHNRTVHQLSTCFVCTKTVKNKHNLRRHVQHHLEPRLKCQLCNKKFHVKSSLKRHLMTHANKALKASGVMRNQCTFAAKHKTVNGKLSELAFMNREAKKGTRRECCSKQFVDPMKYKLHMMNHSGNKSMSFRCFFCECTLPTFSKFSLHQRTHVNISPQQSCVRKGLQKSCTDTSSRTTVPTSKNVGSVVRKNLNQTETANSCKKATLTNSNTLQQGVMSRSKCFKTMTGKNVAFKSKIHPVYTKETLSGDLSFKVNTPDTLKQFSDPAVTAQHKYPQFQTRINLSQNVFDQTLVGNATVKQNTTDITGNGGRERLPQVDNINEVDDDISDETENETASGGLCMIS